MCNQYKLTDFPTIPKIITEDNLVLQKYIIWGVDKRNINNSTTTNELYSYFLEGDKNFTVYNNISDIQTAENLKTKIVEFWNTELFKNPYVDNLNGNYEWLKRLYLEKGMCAALKYQFEIDDDYGFFLYMKGYYKATKTAIITAINESIPIDSVIIYTAENTTDVINRIQKEQEDI
jgi:hypothetical protein